MFIYVLPSNKSNPDIVVLHCGMNDFKKSIADDIVTLALSMNGDNTNVAISSLITRRNYLQTKIAAINKYLKQC